jgi:hypothetical protein
MKIAIHLFVLSALLFSSCEFNKRSSTLLSGNNGGIAVENLKTDIGGLSTTSATLKTVHGDIVFRFYTKAAPRTSARIMQLIQNKFYRCKTILF